MKKIIMCLSDNIVEILVMIGIIAMLYVMAIPSNPNLYTRTGVVISIESDTTVVVEDPTGNLWAFDAGCKEYHCNDEVAMIMDNVGTEDVTDDIIKKVRML